MAAAMAAARRCRTSVPYGGRNGGRKGAEVGASPQPSSPPLVWLPPWKPARLHLGAANQAPPSQVTVAMAAGQRVFITVCNHPPPSDTRPSCGRHAWHVQAGTVVSCAQ